MYVCIYIYSICVYTYTYIYIYIYTHTYIPADLGRGHDRSEGPREKRRGFGVPRLLPGRIDARQPYTPMLQEPWLYLSLLGFVSGISICRRQIRLGQNLSVLTQTRLSRTLPSHVTRRPRLLLLFVLWLLLLVVLSLSLALLSLLSLLCFVILIIVTMIIIITTSVSIITVTITIYIMLNYCQCYYCHHYWWHPRRVSLGRHCRHLCFLAITCFEKAAPMRCALSSLLIIIRRPGGAGVGGEATGLRWGTRGGAPKSLRVC